jgi:hypothetical protein
MPTSPINITAGLNALVRFIATSGPENEPRRGGLLHGTIESSLYWREIDGIRFTADPTSLSAEAYNIKKCDPYIAWDETGKVIRTHTARYGGTDRIIEIAFKLLGDDGDGETTPVPLPALPEGWKWAGHPFAPDQSPEGCWAYKGEKPWESPWADIAGYYGLLGGDPVGSFTGVNDPVKTVLLGIQLVEDLIRKQGQAP